MIGRIATLSYQSAYYSKYKQFFVETLNLKIAGVQFDLLVYDEVEYFRHWSSPLFSYPYQPRLSAIDDFKVNFTKEQVDYSFHQQTTNFQRSRTCLESPWWGQLNIQGEVLAKLEESYKDWTDSWTADERREKAENPEADDCDAEFFEKVMYSSTRSATKKLSEQQDITDQSASGQTILLEMIFQQDPNKSINFRTSLQILDFLGNLGGFLEALTYLGIFSAMYSGTVLRGLIAKNFFLRQRTAKEMRKRKQRMNWQQKESKVVPEDTMLFRERQVGFLRERFAKFNFGECYTTLFYTLVSTSFLCCPFRLCCFKEAQRRYRLICKANDKFGEELDLSDIIGKLRNSQQILTSMLCETDLQLLRLNRERVIVDSGDEQPEDQVSAVESEVEEGLSSDFSAKRLGTSAEEGSDPDAKLIYTKNIVRGMALPDELRKEYFPFRAPRTKAEILEELQWGIEKEREKDPGEKAKAKTDLQLQKHKAEWAQKKREDGDKFAWSPYGKQTSKRNLEEVDLYPVEPERLHADI